MGNGAPRFDSAPFYAELNGDFLEFRTIWVEIFFLSAEGFLNGIEE